MLLKKLKRKLKHMSKTSIVITILVFIVLSCMATGYAVLNQKLNIFGNTNLVIPDYKIYISNVDVESATNGGYATSTATHSGTEVALYTTLPNNNSSVTYEITLNNIGNSAAIADYIYVSSDNNFVKYKIKEINSKDIISKMSERKILVTVEPCENVSTNNLISSIILNFSFIKYFEGYSNECTLSWDGSSSQPPISTNILGITYYQISNANEFKWFIDQVNSGNTGINIMLTKDICLNDKAFTSIADSTTYTGIFDGQNRTIKGINFSRNKEISSGDETYQMGFIKNNGGIIKNVNISATYSDIHTTVARENTSYIGGVVVNNSGIIENVSFSGTITLNATARVNCSVRQSHTTNYIGGIAASNTGIIRGSSNKAVFNLTGKTEKKTCNIYSRSSNIYAGGIASTNSGYIVDSYNSSTISVSGSNESDTRTTNTAKIGGLVSTNNSQISNAYTSGAISQTISGKGDFDFTTDTIGINNGNTSNVYYVSGSISTLPSSPIGTLVSATDLINLNVPIGNAFKLDNKNINNGYPILFWQ